LFRYDLGKKAQMKKAGKQKKGARNAVFEQKKKILPALKERSGPPESTQKNKKWRNCLSGGKKRLKPET